MNSFSINIDNVEGTVWNGRINCEAKWKRLLLDKGETVYVKGLLYAHS